MKKILLMNLNFQRVHENAEVDKRQTSYSFKRSKTLQRFSKVII